MLKREYSQAIRDDGAVIICDGRQITIEEILKRLRLLENVSMIISGAPEVHPDTCDEYELHELNESVEDAFQLITAARSDPKEG